MQRLAIASFVLLLAACVTPVHSPCTTAPENLDGSTAFRILRNAPRVEPPTVGIADARSCYYAAFEVLLAQPDAARRFRELYRSGTVAARIYALDGLHRTDPDTFARLAKTPFFTSSEKVEFVSGCMMREESVATLARIVASGGFQGF